MAVAMPSFLVPIAGQKFFLLEDIYLRGSLRVVANIQERNAMHPSVKKPRMLVITADDGRVWQLLPNGSSWEEFRAKTNYFPFATHDQASPSKVWTFAHNRDTKYITYTLFTADGLQTLADEVVIIDSNVVEFRFLAPIAGHVTLSFAELQS